MKDQPLTTSSSTGGDPRKRRRTQEERRAETSGRLLDATIDILLEVGYSRFRIADVAARAGVSRGGQTHHFATKNDMVEAAIDQVFKSEVSLAQAEASHAPDSEIVRQAARHVEEFLGSKFYQVGLNLLISAGVSDHLADRVRAISARSRAPIELAWINRLVETGTSRDQSEAGLFLLWSVQRGLAIQHLLDCDPCGRDDILDFTIELVNGYLGDASVKEPSLRGGTVCSTDILVKTEHGRRSSGVVMQEIPIEATGQRRQKQDERSAATRERLLETTFRIMREFGHAGLRFANVASEAGVSRGGLLHQYPSKELLIAAVFENIVDKMETRSWERIRSAPDEALLAAIVEDARDRFLGDSFKVMLDILVASGQEQPVAQAVKSLGERSRPSTRDGWADRLSSAGIDRTTAGLVTSFLWNMLKGLAVRGSVKVDKVHDERVIALGLALASRRCGLRTLQTAKARVRRS